MDRMRLLGILTLSLLLLTLSCSKSTDSDQPGNRPPVEPTIDGAAGAPGHETTVQSITPTLAWQCSDPDGDPLTYDVFFGSNPPQQIIAGQSETTYQPGTLAYGTDYYWKVIARDDNDHATSSPIWKFTTLTPENQAPFSPTIDEMGGGPLDSSTEVSLSTTLHWRCADPENDPLTYDVHFGTENPPPLVSDGQTGRSHDPGGLEHATTYYWQITAKDNHDHATNSPVWQFSTTTSMLEGEYTGTYSYLEIINGIDTTVDTSQLIEFEFTSNLYFMFMDPSLDESERVFCDVWGSYDFQSVMTLTEQNGNIGVLDCDENLNPTGEFSVDQIADTLTLSQQNTEAGVFTIKELRLISQQ